MNHFELKQHPRSIQVAGTTRAGLIVASVKGLFAATDAVAPLEGAEVQRAFEIETTNAPELILSLLRNAASMATAHQEAYTDISFSLITDKKAVGLFIGRPAAASVVTPTILGIDGEIIKDGDGVWRATIALKKA